MTSWQPVQMRRGGRRGAASAHATMVDSAAARPKAGQIQPNTRRIGELLARHRRQERRRDDVAEAEGAVAGDHRRVAGASVGVGVRRGRRARAAPGGAAASRPQRPPRPPPPSSQPAGCRRRPRDAARRARPRRPAPCRRRRRQTRRPAQPRPARRERASAQRDTPTSTNALATPADEAQHQPRRERVGHAHRQRAQRHRDEPAASRAPRRRRDQDARSAPAR